MNQLQLPFDDLTREIIQHIRKLGGWGTRVNVSGFYDPDKGFWRKGVTDPGTPDVMAVVNGLFIGVEVKTGHDRLRPQQTTTKQAIEQAEGIFLVAKDIAQFRDDLRTILKNSRGDNP